MRRTTGLRFVLVSLVAAGAACGGSGGTSGPPATAGEACKNIYSTLRMKAGDCGTGLDIIITETLIDIQCGLIQKYSDAGTIKYESSKYTDCKAAVDASRCGAEDPKINETCGRLFGGVRAGGESCKSGLEC